MESIIFWLIVVFSMGILKMWFDSQYALVAIGGHDIIHNQHLAEDPNCTNCLTCKDKQECTKWIDGLDDLYDCLNVKCDSHDPNRCLSLYCGECKKLHIDSLGYAKRYVVNCPNYIAARSQ